MKKGIHPDYYTAKVTCSCGNSFEVGATVKEIHVEICAACHPFYTGTQKYVDTAGRVERFQERMNKVKDKTTKRQDNKVTKEIKKDETNKDKLKEIRKSLVGSKNH